MTSIIRHFKKGYTEWRDLRMPAILFLALACALPIVTSVETGIACILWKMTSTDSDGLTWICWKMLLIINIIFTGFYYLLDRLKR